MAHPNEQVLRKGYEAFDKSDLETIAGLFADDVVWTVNGKSPLAGVYKGKDEVFGFFAQVITLSEGTFKIEVHDVLANDEHGVVLGTSRAQRGGKSLEVKTVDSFHMKNGKVAEAWLFVDDLYAEDDFWS